MKRQSLALSKGRQLATNSLPPRTTSNFRIASNDSEGQRYYAAKSTVVESEKPRHNGAKSEHDAKGSNGIRQNHATRDFFLSVLGSTATKRDARAYLNRFTPSKNSSSNEKAVENGGKESNSVPPQHGVNLGTFYDSRAMDDSPQFVQGPYTESASFSTDGPQHVALVKIRAPQEMDDETLDGVARTLSQLAKLGMTSTVVVDCDDYAKSKDMTVAAWKDLAIEQVDRITAAIDAHGKPGARKTENVIGIRKKELGSSRITGPFHDQTHVIYRKHIMIPLKRGIIPVVPCIAYTDEIPRAVPVTADDVVLALTREFAGLGFREPPHPDEDPHDTAERLKALRSEVSLDRLIILDPLGGIPTANQANGYHVFLNMEQEFHIVKKDLLAAQLDVSSPQSEPENLEEAHLSDIARSNPFSKFVETEFRTPFTSQAPKLIGQSISDHLPRNLIHLQNLDLVRRVLSLLPPTSSALLTTPTEAANSGKDTSSQADAPGVGTRARRNPLIHNLLTDKPVYSSSLPAGRLGQSSPTTSHTSPTSSTQPIPTTFAKRGMSLSIFPNPAVTPWRPPVDGTPQITLTDPHIDLPRLVHLINDSFDRTLDVPAYLKRVNNRIAGVIIAGEYDGGALLTWELPPGVPDDGSPESRARMVPYLDKFAVLKRSQGSGGVADVVFKAMVRDCFPEGVCWRSRRNNPVNKWYFERSRGTWKMPGTEWTMFWTTKDVDGRDGVFKDYEGVCKSIQPTWADRKKLVD